MSPNWFKCYYKYYGLSSLLTDGVDNYGKELVQKEALFVLVDSFRSRKTKVSNVRMFARVPASTE